MHVMRAMRRRMNVAIPGLILSLGLAALAFLLVPAQYSSTGIALLVQPKQPGGARSSSNPLLAFDNSLSTTALLLVQSLDTPTVDDELGLTGTPDKFVMKNVAATPVAGGGDSQPFIYITAQGSTPERS